MKYKPKEPTTLTVSDARTNLYSIVKKVSSGYGPYEVTQRDDEPVIIMSKEDYEGWLETLDIMSHPEEVAALKRALKQKKTYTHAEVMKMLGL